jgi:multidrug resistance efflux pump
LIGPSLARPPDLGSNQFAAGVAVPAQFSRTTRSLASDSGARALVVWAVIAALLVCWLGWFFFGRVTVYEVSAKARLEVRQAAHPVSAWLPSRIVKNSLSIGAAVRAGEVLVELDASSETLLLREEEARRRAIAPQIDALQREIDAHERAGAHDRDAALAARRLGVHASARPPPESHLRMTTSAA